MLTFFRQNAKLIAVAAVCIGIGLSAPAVGHGVNHALFAHNADKVDGKHAVGAGATVTNRKGKLVATSGTTGRLPNNIIAKAPDANLLDGMDSTAFALAGHGHDVTFDKQGSIQAVIGVNTVTVADVVVPPADPCGGGLTLHRYAAFANATIQQLTSDDLAAGERARLSVTTATTISPGVNDVLELTKTGESIITTLGTQGVFTIGAGGGTIRLLADILDNAGQYTVSRGYLTVLHLGYTCP